MHPGIVNEQTLRAARANRVFRADEKRIRTKNTVLDKGNYGLGLVFYKIADCARTASRPRKESQLCNNRRRDLSRHV
jgi:hypothetical protein